MRSRSGSRRAGFHGFIMPLLLSGYPPCTQSGRENSTNLISYNHCNGYCKKLQWSFRRIKSDFFLHFAKIDQKERKMVEKGTGKLSSRIKRAKEKAGMRRIRA
jgi:hypothetical protein